MDKQELMVRTKQFAHRCVKLAGSLPHTVLGNHIRNQLIRSSTSVACNYRAVCYSQSRASFISKLAIVIEESDESCFWIEFIIEEDLIKKERIQPLLNEAEELKAIFIASRKTATRNVKTKV